METASESSQQNGQSEDSGATKGSSSSKGELLVLKESASCATCRYEFERVYVTLGGRRLGGPVATLCERCTAAAEPPPNTQPSHAMPAPPEITTLAACGVNVNQHGSSTFGSYRAETNDAALSATAEFVATVRESAAWEHVRGLYLCGETGVGKTHLAVAATRVLLERLGPEGVLFDRASRLITDLQDTYGSGKTGPLLDRRERVRVWVLDDFGTEKATDDSLRLLYDLINAREGRATMITSNFPPKALGERWRDSDAWARIASRLGSEQYRLVAVRGRDRRFT